MTKVCLIGVYELALSPALGAMAGTHKILHCIASDKAVPIFKCLKATVRFLYVIFVQGRCR